MALLTFRPRRRPKRILSEAERARRLDAAITTLVRRIPLVMDDHNRAREYPLPGLTREETEILLWLFRKATTGNGACHAER